jgi:hypothetical protein
MRARELVALVVFVPALALGPSACGGGGGGGAAKPTAAQLETLEAKWRAGLLDWRRAMLHGLDGLSLIFATDGSVAALSRAGSGSSTRLTTFEGRIATCSDKVRLLGPAPEPFQQSRVYALEACKRLSAGISRVNEVVADLRHGIAVDPIDPLGDATVLLATGQTELSTAVDALDAPSA